MMKIIHLNTEKTWRGGERQTFWLARELRDNGHEVWVACRPDFPLSQECEKAGLRVISIQPWMEADVFAAWRLRRFLKAQGIDILHAHTGHAVGLGALAVSGSCVRFLCTRRVDFPLKRNFLSQWKYGKLHGMAVISQKIYDVVQSSGFSLPGLSVIPSGIDSCGYPSADQAHVLRQDKGYGDHEVLLVHAGALVPHKDQNTLLEAMRIVCHEMSSAKLLILGDGPLKKTLVQKRDQLGLTAHVDFLGHRADVLDYMAMGHVFVFSSQEEGLGTSLLDALAVGVPTAATRAGGIPDIYGSDDAPELSPVRDPKGLAGNILKVLKDPEEAGQRVMRGKEIAAKFSVKAMTEKYVELYERLIAKGKEHRA